MEKAAYFYVYVCVYVHVYVHVYVIVYAYVYDTLIWSDNKQHKPYTLYNQAMHTPCNAGVQQATAPTKCDIVLSMLSLCVFSPTEQ